MKQIAPIILIFFFCSSYAQTSQIIVYQTLKIDDALLLAEFNNAGNCLKLEIIEFFKKELFPFGKGHANEFIKQIEEITKIKSSRDGTYFGPFYKSEVDLDKDMNKWSIFLGCKK